jgi:uncharacterized YigZ family protein
MTRYPVPARTLRIENMVSNSRFIATVTRTDAVSEAKAFIQSIRDEMPDASHHVYAFKIGYGGSVIEGMSDDGEPSGTSGPPVLAVLRGADIGDIAIVVTRYFGGTKLGTGGLVRAYRGAAKDALAVLPVTMKIDKRSLGVSLPYRLYEPVKLLLSGCDAEIESEDFAADVTVFARIPADRLDELIAGVRNLTAGQVEPVLLDDSPG